jgi:colanic acid/amylovoran biosynthesis glycosyltransferase
MTHCSKSRIIVYCDHLLYPSETFIHAQTSALSEYDPILVGARRVAGLDLQEQRVHVINQGSTGGRIRELGFKLFGHAPGLLRELKNLQPSLLHAHYGPNGLRALPLANSLNVPMIITFHGSDATITDLRHQKTHLGFRLYLANKPKLRHANALFLVVSKFLRRKLLEQGFPEERIIVQYTGVDTTGFQPKSTERTPIILYVGRLEESKGAEFAIRAAARVQQRLPLAELVLIGDGSLRARLEQLAQSLLGRYRFLGFRPPDQVRQWMNRASVVCVPSVRRRSGEEEAFGMVCAEALAVAKPVVAFNSGGISEVVRHASTGFLVPEGDWGGMAEYLCLLLENPDLRKNLGQTGRTLVLSQFDLHKCTKQLERIYATVIQEYEMRKHGTNARQAHLDHSQSESVSVA